MFFSFGSQSLSSCFNSTIQHLSDSKFFSQPTNRVSQKPIIKKNTCIFQFSRNFRISRCSRTPAHASRGKTTTLAERGPREPLRSENTETKQHPPSNPPIISIQASDVVGTPASIIVRAAVHDQIRQTDPRNKPPEARLRDSSRSARPRVYFGPASRGRRTVCEKPQHPQRVV